MRKVRQQALVLVGIALGSGQALAHGVGPGGSTGSPPTEQSGPQDLTAVVPVPSSQAFRALGVLEKAALWRPGSAIKVCFLAGDQGLRRDIASVMSEWTSGVNLKLDFGSSDYQSCSTGDDSDVRIGFSDPAVNYSYSYVGTQSREQARRGKQTMNFYRFDVARPSPTEFRRIVLHETGHLFGLEHEQQNPQANYCREHFDPGKLRAYFGKFGWTPSMVEVFVTRAFDVSTVTTTAFNPRSIMYYAFVPDVFVPGTSDVCWIYNTQLSDDDISIVRTAYPFTAVRTSRLRFLGLTEGDLDAAVNSNRSHTSDLVKDLLSD